MVESAECREREREMYISLGCAVLSCFNEQIIIIVSDN